MIVAIACSALKLWQSSRAKLASFERVSRKIRVELLVGGYSSFSKLKDDPLVYGYVSGAIESAARQAAPTWLHPEHLVLQFYDEVLDDPNLAMAMLCNTKAMRVEPAFTEGYELARVDFDDANVGEETLRLRRWFLSPQTRPSATVSIRPS